MSQDQGRWRRFPTSGLHGPAEPSLPRPGSAHQHGGWDQAGLAILSRLVEERTVLFSKQARDGAGWTALSEIAISPSERPHYRGQIVLLTSEMTASAAEVFTLSTLALDNVTRLGQATDGVFSDMLYKTLPNGWVLTLSNERYLSITGECPEGEGVVPDVRVPCFTTSDRGEGKDSVLEAAIQQRSP